MSVEIRGVANNSGLGKVQPNSSARPASDSAIPAGQSDGDQVQISSAARYMGQYSNLPAIRADKVAAARQSIQSGTMDTDAKLSVAIDRLLDDLLS